MTAQTPTGDCPALVGSVYYCALKQRDCGTHPDNCSLYQKYVKPKEREYRGCLEVRVEFVIPDNPVRSSEEIIRRLRKVKGK